MTQLIGLGGQKNANFTFWDTNQQYRTDDMVVYNNEIYSANENIAAGTAWDPAQWSFVMGTGDVTFDGATVQGDNSSLNLSAGPDFTANDSYLQLRQGNDTTDVVLATGDDSLNSLYLGGAQQFVQVANTGNVVIQSYDGTMPQTSAWQFLGNGAMSVPGGLEMYNSGLLQALDTELRLTARNDSGTSTPLVMSIESAALEIATTTLTGDDFTISLDLNGTPQTWQFDSTGNMTLPGNTFAVNYANGDPVTFGGGSSLPTGTSPWQILAWNYDGVDLTWQIAPNPVFWNLPQNSSDSAYETAVNAVGQGLLVGSRYFNTANGVLRVYNGSQWADAGSASTPTTLAALGTKPQGFRAFITDSQTPAAAGFGQPVTGGGAFKTPVWTDGVDWYLG